MSYRGTSKKRAGEDGAGETSAPALEPSIAGAIGAALAPLDWPAARRAAVRDYALASVATNDDGATAPEAMQVQRAGEGRWYALLPRIALKPLRIDRITHTQTTLWKLEPGARIPAHEHGAEEECLILDGSVEYEGVRYRAGDYLLAKPGFRHHEIASATGATLLIRGELSPHLEALFAT